jgi:cellulase
MICFQVNITSGGTANPPGVSFPGAYKASDPGTLINIYQTISNYVIPGPAVWTG